MNPNITIQNLYFRLKQQASINVVAVQNEIKKGQQTSDDRDYQVMMALQLHHYCDYHYYEAPRKLLNAHNRFLSLENNMP